MAETTREQKLTGSTDPATQQVVDLLTSILTEARTQIRGSTPKPLEGKAADAVALFREIGATLALLPTISLTADPTRLDQKGPVTLTWSSTEAQTVSIEAEDPSGNPLPSPGEVSPVEGGSYTVQNVSETTIFTATATSKGPCREAEAEAKVVFGHGVS
jgi:hypothetical protein